MTLPEATPSIVVVAVFLAVYAGIALGRWPMLRIDRTGVALIGAIVLLIALDDPASTARHVDLPTLAILFGLMVLSAQFATAGFYDWCAARLAAARLSERALLAAVVGVTGGLSTVLANDVVVFAMTPMLCRGLVARGSDPRPFLLAHAAAANAGSAATLIGNPQNILIGEFGGLDFWHYLSVAAPPALAALVLVHVVILLTWRREIDGGGQRAAAPAREAQAEVPGLDRAAMAKAAAATAALLALFASPLPRWQGVLLVAGFLLLSRKLSTRDILGLVDWHLLVLFAGLFIVTGALSDTGLPAQMLDAVPALVSPWTVAGVSLLGSNTVGNVPLVMLVLAALPQAGEKLLHGLAILSTLAGNLLIVGSIANIIVVEQAGRQGVAITFGQHARAGLPLTIASMALAAVWLILVGR